MKLCDDHIEIPLGEYCIECDNHMLALELSGEIGVSDDFSPPLTILEKEEIECGKTS